MTFVHQFLTSVVFVPDSLFLCSSDSKPEQANHRPRSQIKLSDLEATNGKPHLSPHSNIPPSPVMLLIMPG